MKIIALAWSTGGPGSSFSHQTTQKWGVTQIFGHIPAQKSCLKSGTSITDPHPCVYMHQRDLSLSTHHLRVSEWNTAHDFIPIGCEHGRWFLSLCTLPLCPLAYSSKVYGSESHRKCSSLLRDPRRYFGRWRFGLTLCVSFRMANKMRCKTIRCQKISTKLYASLYMHIICIFLFLHVVCF